MEEKEGAQIEPQEAEDKEPQLDLDIPEEDKLPALPHYIPTEFTLESIGFFTPSSKRIKNIYEKVKVIKTIKNEDGSTHTIKAEFSANHALGLPITSDNDYFRAFQAIIDELADKNGRIQLPIPTPTRKLIRYTGKQVNARTWKEAREWLERMTATLIKGGIYFKKKEAYDDAFVGTLFSQIILRGRQTRNGKTADTNLVWPSPWFLSNYYHRYRRSTDHNLYKRLRKPISKALLSLLETGWYASGGNPYSKNYRELCKEFLLREEKHLAHIKKQLDPSHRELKDQQFLEGWRYHLTPSKTCIVTYYPGKKFFIDQKVRAGKKTLPQPEAPPLSAEEERTLEDIKIITGEPDNPIWLQILKDYPLGEISMALAETRQADAEGRITKNRGAYFIDTLKRLHEAHNHPKPT